MLSKAISVSELPVKSAVSSAVLQRDGFREQQRNQPGVWTVEANRDKRKRRNENCMKAKPPLPRAELLHS